MIRLRGVFVVIAALLLVFISYFVYPFSISDTTTLAMGNSSSHVTQAAMVSARERVEKLIAENTVMVFSKSYCPYCTKTKQLLKKEGVEYALFELDQDDDGSALQAALQQISGQRTVPNVFVKEVHVGGNDDIHSSVRSGAFKKLLAA
eukprot:CFRG1691T1